MDLDTAVQLAGSSLRLATPLVFAALWWHPKHCPAARPASTPPPDTHDGPQTVPTAMSRVGHTAHR